MIYVNLANQDFKYEIYELIKVFFFGEEIIFIDDREEYHGIGLLIENRLIKEGNKVDSLLKIYDDNKLIYESKEKDLQSIDIGEDNPKRKIRIGVKKGLYEGLIHISNIKAPWGILTGIRPAKIVHGLLDNEIQEDNIRNILLNEYKISSEKVNLILNICKRQRKYLYPLNENRFSLYIDIPFCPSRCLYCSFPSCNINKYSKYVDEYTDKLIYEINNIKDIMRGKSISTVYIGGGTPTAIPMENLDRIILSIYDNFGRENIEEITVEAGRPDTISKEMLKMLNKNNIDRISINPQTMNDNTLKLIGRKHNSMDIVKSYYLAKEIGFNIINMDLIIGLPGEGLREIQNTLNEIQKLNPENLSVHTLAIKRGSKFIETMDKYPIKDQAIIGEMLQKTESFSKYMKLYPYYLYRQKQILGNFENIGYAKKGNECVYNIKMMEEKETIMAAGMGAVSKIFFPKENRIERAPNVKSLEEYLNRTEEMLKRKVQALNG